jgi:uncharacterized protein (TIGR02453 family)
MAARFTGFGPDLLAFLKGLAANNHKAWFDANRGVYETAVKGPLGDFVETLSAEFAKAKLDLKGDRKSLFRMNKDIRFSKDKTPYKTNAGAVLSPTGDKKSVSIFYIHFEPAASFFAAGFYMPEPAALTALRTAIVEDAAAFKKLMANLKKNDLTIDTHDDALARPPKGFTDTTDEVLLPILKQRHLTVSRQLSDDEVLSASLARTAVTFAKATAPLLRFGRSALQ